MLLGLQRFRATVECSDAVAMDDAAMAVYFAKPLLTGTRRRVDSRTGAVDIEEGGAGPSGDHVVPVHVSDALPLVLQPATDVADAGRGLAHRDIKRGGGRVMGRDSVVTDSMAAAARVGRVVDAGGEAVYDGGGRGIVTVAGPSRRVVEVLTAHEAAAEAAGALPPATPAGSEPTGGHAADPAEEAAATAATIPAALLELTGADPAVMRRDHAAEVAHDKEAMEELREISPPGGAPPEPNGPGVESVRPPAMVAGIPRCWGGAPAPPGAAEAAMVLCRTGCQRCAAMSQLRYLGNAAEGIRIERGVSAEHGAAAILPTDATAVAVAVADPSAAATGPAAAAASAGSQPPSRTTDRHYSGSFVTIGVMNMGGADARFAHASDSMADVLMARKGGLLSTVGLMLRYVGRNMGIADERNSSLYTYEKARTVVVTPDPRYTNPAFQAANVDGEVLPGPGPFRIHTLPSFLTAYGQF
jgi:hypothetical protein